jgi:hypothetical protein
MMQAKKEYKHAILSWLMVDVIQINFRKRNKDINIKD